MLRGIAILVSALALVALMTGPAALAQAPVPKVTINGLVDQVTNWNRNLSIVDGNLDDKRDKEWYSRTRIRPDITAEVGTTKFVLGLELDFTWGQTGDRDVGTPQRFAESAGADLNTDFAGVLEVKWGYTEFDVPLIPLPTRLRLGAQPFATTYKGGVLATGDFAGAHVSSVLADWLRLNVTYGQLEESSVGSRFGFTRGNDYTVIGSLEITPVKGLDVRPLYGVLVVDGTIAGVARQGRGGVSSAAATFGGGNREYRHTIGVDARWKAGPFSLDPTVMYQFGSREITTGGSTGEQDRSAWFVDVRGGWSSGPVILEGAVVYTTGNKASQDLRNPRKDVKYFEVIDADASYYATWAEIIGINIDYNSALFYNAGGVYPSSINMANSIGYDKYGLFRVGGRASYALTPALTFRGAATANWTAEKVDTQGSFAGASGITPSAAAKGRERYLGTEVDLGLTYRFAPSIALDLVGAYLFAGEAFARADAPDPKDVQMVTARVRYTF